MAARTARCRGCGWVMKSRKDLSQVSRLCVSCSAARIIRNAFGMAQPGSDEWHAAHDAQLKAAKNAPIDPDTV